MPQVHAQAEGEWERERCTPLPPSGRRRVIASYAGFDAFWMAYPKKKSKAEAEAAFAKLAPDEPMREAMLAALERHKASIDWQRDDGRYVPHPATWLRNRRWEDESPAMSTLWEGAA